MSGSNDDDKKNIDSSSPAAESSLSSIETIAKMGADLVRHLLADVDLLFISQPLTIR